MTKIELTESVKKEIRRIVREEVRAALRDAAPDLQIVSDEISPLEESRLREMAMATYRQDMEKRAETARLEDEIRRESSKIPPEFRPNPEQYKSQRSKLLVLQMLKEPARWKEIPDLPVQRPSKRHP